MPKSGITRRPVEQVLLRGEELARRERRDQLATEEPLEIRVVPSGEAPVAVSVTMRTPGADFELAAGFLYSEGLVGAREEIAAIRYCDGRSGATAHAAGRGRGGRSEEERENVVNVFLAPGACFRPEEIRRNFYATSSCGVCGKGSIEAVWAAGCPVVAGGASVDARTLLSLPERLRGAQPLFERTGGIHAAALFSTDGEILRLREDVGRHNALDKLVGAALLAGELPLAGRVVLASGRLSFELVQKAARAGVPVLAGVSAPSSLAVELAEETGITLVGFLREGRFNLYTGGERIALPPAPLSGGQA